MGLRSCIQREPGPYIPYKVMGAFEDASLFHGGAFEDASLFRQQFFFRSSGFFSFTQKQASCQGLKFHCCLFHELRERKNGFEHLRSCIQREPSPYIPYMVMGAFEDASLFHRGI